MFVIIRHHWMACKLGLPFSQVVRSTYADVESQVLVFHWTCVRMRCQIPIFEGIWEAPGNIRVAPLQNKMAPKSFDIQNETSHGKFEHATRRPRNHMSPFQLSEIRSLALSQNLSPAMSKTDKNFVPLTIVSTTSSPLGHATFFVKIPVAVL